MSVAWKQVWHTQMYTPCGIPGNQGVVKVGAFQKGRMRDKDYVARYSVHTSYARNGAMFRSYFSSRVGTIIVEA